MKLKELSFQENDAARVFNHVEENGVVLLQLWTGGGKTVISGKVLDKILNKNSDAKTLFVVNRTTLPAQVYQTMQAFGISAAILHNELKYDIFGNVMNTDIENASVVITVADTVNKAIENLKKRNIDFDYIVFDEAHKATSETNQQIRDAFPKHKRIGLTATPYREKNENGSSLDEWYGKENLICSVSVNYLIEIGQLVQPRYYKFNEDSHVVNTWSSLTEGFENRRTIVFAYNVQHAKKLMQAFRNAGVSSEMIVTSSEDEELTSQTLKQRNEIYRAFRDNEIEVLVSVNALCEGFDEKSAHFALLCRRVGNVALFHQMIGRVLRSDEEGTKNYGYVVDFYDNVERFGPIEDWEWNLEEDSKKSTYVGNGDATITMNTMNKNEKVFISCDGCGHVYNMKAHNRCTHCNTPHNVKIKANMEDLRNQLYTAMVNSEKGKKFLDSLEENDRKTKSATQKKNSKTTSVSTNFSNKKFVLFMKKVEQAKKNDKGLMLNKMIGVEIFDDNSTFSEEYNWLDKVLNTNYTSLTTKDKIEI